MPRRRFFLFSHPLRSNAPAAGMLFIQSVNGHMRALLLIFFLVMITMSVCGQSTRNQAIGELTSFNSDQSRLIVIGSDNLSKALFPPYGAQGMKTGDSRTFHSIQYLYLKNYTIFNTPSTGRAGIEILKKEHNKVIFRILEIQADRLNVDLEKILHNNAETGAQIATVSFQ